MVKSNILNIEGKKIKEIDLPKVFERKIREDIVARAFGAQLTRQAYGPSKEAGKKHSASGKVRHRRHRWKSHYGRGISRIPRKTMWRRGTQFFWIGASIPGTRGGRKAHPPKPEKNWAKKINKKEKRIAIESALAATGNNKLVKNRYERLKNEKIEIKNLPFIVESKITNLKTKQLLGTLKKILGNVFEVALQKKSIRAGKGKMRGRKYKKNAGMILVIGKKEKLKSRGIEIKNVDKLGIKELYPLGRLVVYTEQAIKDLEVGKGVEKK